MDQIIKNIHIIIKYDKIHFATIRKINGAQI